MKKLYNRPQLLSNWIFNEAPAGPLEAGTSVEKEEPEIDTPEIQGNLARAGAEGVVLSPDHFTQPEATEIGELTRAVEGAIDGPDATLRSGADTLIGATGDDILAEPATEVTAALAGPQIDLGLTALRSEEYGVIMSPDIEAEVRASFEMNPFSAEGLTETEIQEEIEVRVLNAKSEAIRNRTLTPETEDAVAVTEADYLSELAEAQGLDPETLLIARARNQAGIGAEVDETGEITDPEAYQAELETFAENYAAAQAYLEANADIAETNPLIQARALAIMNGEDPATIDDGLQADDERHLIDLTTDLRLGEGVSPIGRMVNGDTRPLQSTDTGIGTIPLDPTDLDNVPPLDQQTYAPGSEEAQQLFAEAARSNGMPAEWGASQGLHSILEKESGGIVGRLNYTFGPVAQNMGASLDDPQFMSWAHQRLQEGATASDFGIRSTACGLGQCIRANVEAYYPSGFEGIGDPIEEAAGMLGYIKERYGNPDQAFAEYGVHHEGY